VTIGFAFVDWCEGSGQSAPSEHLVDVVY